MSIKILPSSEVRNHMAQIIKETSQDGSVCFITQHGKAEVVLLGVARYNQMLSLLEDVMDEKDASLGARVTEARKNYKKSGGWKFEV